MTGSLAGDHSPIRPQRGWIAFAALLLALGAGGCSAAPIESPGAGPEASETLQAVPSAPPAPTAPPTATATAPPTPLPTPSPEPFEGPTVIGTSVAGKPLEVYRFGTGPSKRLIAAGIHGGYEWNTIALAGELIGLLEKDPGIVPPGVTLYILPAINPDGEAKSHGYDGRANSNGVDINRNFPHRWQRDWSKFGCWSFRPIHGGEHPASEPETQAVMRFVLGEHIEALISYHSAALGIFPGGQPPDERSLSLAENIAGVTRYPYPPIQAGCIYTGQFADWASANGIAAVDVELTNHHELDFEINLRVLLAFLSW